MSIRLISVLCICYAESDATDSSGRLPDAGKDDATEQLDTKAMRYGKPWDEATGWVV